MAPITFLTFWSVDAFITWPAWRPWIALRAERPWLTLRMKTNTQTTNKPIFKSITVKNRPVSSAAFDTLGTIYNNLFNCYDFLEELNLCCKLAFEIVSWYFNKREPKRNFFRFLTLFWPLVVKHVHVQNLNIWCFTAQWNNTAHIFWQTMRNTGGPGQTGVLNTHTHAHTLLVYVSVFLRKDAACASDVPESAWIQPGNREKAAGGRPWNGGEWVRSQRCFTVTKIKRLEQHQNCQSWMTYEEKSTQKCPGNMWGSSENLETQRCWLTAGTWNLDKFSCEEPKQHLTNISTALG